MERRLDPALPGQGPLATDPSGGGAGAHPLDHPIWSALTTVQRPFAQGAAGILRYSPEVAPFLATLAPTPEGDRAMAALIGSVEPTVMIQAEAPVLSGPFDVLTARNLEQMVGPAMTGTAPRADLRRLGLAEVPAMMALVDLTKPGPFAVRTHELGTYLGLYDGSRLIAMAGERMHLDGFTEVSAVCVHPDHRGRGHSRTLITALSQAITARGETPFLHVLSENLPAIAVYLDLGFTLRASLSLTVVQRTP